MSDDINVRRAFEKTLAAMVSPLATAYENIAFTPEAGVPYQRINILRADPADLVMGRTLTQLQGICQVSLFYPQGMGTADAELYAARIKALFKPPTSITEGGTRVDVNNTATIATGFTDDDRWVVPVSIPWSAYVKG